MAISKSLASLALCIALTPWAHAQEFPSKPVRIIVPYPAGGVVDGLARSLSVGMKDALGQPVVVENKPGAGGIPGMQACGLAAPDGHTICFTVQDSLSFNGFFYKSLPYNPETGFAPITNLGWTNGLIVANGKTGLTTYEQMVVALKKSPGKLNFGTWGDASQPDVLMRAMAGQAGVSFTPIPYKGQAQSAAAVVSGEVDVTYMGIGMALPHIEAGRLKPLLLTGKSRNDSVPGIPTMQEVGADVGLASYFLAVAPAKVPPAALEKLHAAIVKAAQTPSVQQFYQRFTLTFVGDSPTVFAEFVKKDRANAVRAF